MALNQEQQDALVKIISILYDRSLIANRPTEKTARLLEELLVKVQECDRKISVLFSGIICGVSMPVLRGGSTGQWILKCAKSIAKAMSENKTVFAGCSAVVSGAFREKIYYSTM